jgi:DNA-binding response OmpR family regulator
VTDDISVLLVEENADLERLLRKILITEDYRVLSAFTSQEAFRHIDEATVDILILDGELMHAKADEVLEEARNRGYAGPVIIFSAAIEAHAMHRKLNVDGWLRKPFDPQRLLGLVSVLVASREVAGDQ